MSRLTRRALFALPVALPVAAVAAKVGVAAPVERMWGGVLSPAAVRRLAGLDAGGLDDRFVLWVTTSVRDGMSRHWKIPPREGAADAAKPVTAQVAAPVGDTTSRSLEGDASDSVAPRQMAEPVVPTGNEGTSGERDTIALPVAA